MSAPTETVLITNIRPGPHPPQWWARGQVGSYIVALHILALTDPATGKGGYYDGDDFEFEVIEPEKHPACYPTRRR